MTASLRRIYALILRYAMLLKGSPPRLFETAYWPTLNIMFLGFFNQYLMKKLGNGISFEMILAATVLLEFYQRGSMGLMLAFVEEIYSRNIAPLYISPLRAGEQLISYGIVMLMRLVIGLVPALIICALLFHYNLATLGWWVAPFIINLIFSGTVVGIFVVSLLLRFGQSAEWFGWMLGWFFIPFMGVYYPLEILPGWMHVVGLALPPSYIFQSLRHISAGEPVLWLDIIKASALNVAYLGAALGVFYATLRGARKRGALMNLSE